MQAQAALRPRDAAAYLGIGQSTIWRRAKNEPSTFPQPCKLGPSTTVWLVKDLDAFIERCASVEDQAS